MVEVGSPGILLWVALALLPLVLAACTAFTKASVVLSAVRIGLGAQQLLPWGVVFALSVVVTAIVMGPVGVATASAIEGAGGLETLAAASPGQWLEVLEPLRAFMARHASASELEFFAALQGVDAGHPLALVPAFLVTELAEAFEMAVLILVPLVAIDLMVAQLYAMVGVAGGQSQALVTLPAKLLLFLAVNGWDLIIAGLVEGYR